MKVIILALLLILRVHHRVNGFVHGLNSKNDIAFATLRKTGDLYQKARVSHLQFASFHDAFASTDALDDYQSEKLRYTKKAVLCDKSKTVKAIDRMYYRRRLRDLIHERRWMNVIISIILYFSRKTISVFSVLAVPPCNMIEQL